MTITPAQLEEWKRLESEATAGEWLNDVEGCVGIRYAEGGQATICTCPIAFSYHNGRNDAAFIASSRTALPALIAEVERLNAEVSLMARERLTEEAQHRGEYDLTPPKDSTNE